MKEISERNDTSKGDFGTGVFNQDVQRLLRKLRGQILSPEWAMKPGNLEKD